MRIYPPDLVESLVKRISQAFGHSFRCGPLTVFTKYPEIGFVYVLVKNLEIVYVGKTFNLSSRLGDHRYKGRRFETAYYCSVPRNFLDAAERELIQTFNPPWNKLHANHPELRLRTRLESGVAL